MQPLPQPSSTPAAHLCVRSLRAKLSHAFDLLRTYQHKCRVLDATVQVTSSRPASPGCQTPAAAAAAGGWGGIGVDAQQLAGCLSLLESSRDGSMPVAPVCAAGQRSSDTEAAAGYASSRQLSPVEEGPWEGASPAGHSQALPSSAGSVQQPQLLPAATQSAAQRPAPASPAPPSAAGVATRCAAVPPDSAQVASHPLPQLEALKMLAQALLEAQAEVAAKQQQQAVEAAGLLPALRLPRGALVFDACLGPYGGYLIAPPPPDSQCAGSDGSVDGGRTISSGSTQPSKSQAPERVPLAAVPQHAAERNDSSPTRCQSLASPGRPGSSSGRGGRELVIDDCLMDLLRDVESMAPQQRSGSGRAVPGLQPASYGTLLPAVQAEASSLYEENDLLCTLDLIAQV